MLKLICKIYKINNTTTYNNISAKYLRTLSDLFSPNLIDQSSGRILTTHAKTRPILHNDWSIRLGENRPDRALKHLVTMLLTARFNMNTANP